MLKSLVYARATALESIPIQRRGFGLRNEKKSRKKKLKKANGTINAFTLSRKSGVLQLAPLTYI